MEGLRTEEQTVIIVVTFVSYGCPIQAIVHADGLDERTGAEWQTRAGKQCQRCIMPWWNKDRQVKSQQIQAAEIRAKGRKRIIWIALAMDVTRSGEHELRS